MREFYAPVPVRERHERDSVLRKEMIRVRGVVHNNPEEGIEVGVRWRRSSLMETGEGGRKASIRVWCA